MQRQATPAAASTMAERASLQGPGGESIPAANAREMQDSATDAATGGPLQRRPTHSATNAAHAGGGDSRLPGSSVVVGPASDLASQLQWARDQMAQLQHQNQVEQEVRGAAQQLLAELQEQHNAAVEEAEEERAQRDALLAQLADIQSRYAGLADFVWHLDLSQLDPQGLQAASQAAAATAADSAGAGGHPGGGGGRGGGDTPLLHFALSPSWSPAPSPLQPAAQREGSAGVSPDAGQASGSRIEAGAGAWDGRQEEGGREELAEQLAVAQAQLGDLLLQLQRAQHERDAVMYRLDEMEAYLRQQAVQVAGPQADQAVQTAEQQVHAAEQGQLGVSAITAEAAGASEAADGSAEQQADGPLPLPVKQTAIFLPRGLTVDVDAAAAPGATSAPATCRSSVACTPFGPVPQLQLPAPPRKPPPPSLLLPGQHDNQQQQQQQQVGQYSPPSWPAAHSAQQLLASLAALVAELAAGGQEWSGGGGSVGCSQDTQDTAGSGGSGKTGLGGQPSAAEVHRHLRELQVRVEVLCDQLAAASEAAEKLGAEVEEERAARCQLAQRLAAAGRDARAGRQERLLLQQHVVELEELVCTAIDEAESSRELLQKVTAAQAGEDGSPGAKLRLGELWSKLMEAEQRASAALRSGSASPNSPTAAAAGTGQHSSLLQAWRMLESAGLDTGGSAKPKVRPAVAAAHTTPAHSAPASAARSSAHSKQVPGGSLRSRLAALSRRYSSGGAELAAPAAAAAGKAAAHEAEVDSLAAEASSSSLGDREAAPEEFTFAAGTPHAQGGHPSPSPSPLHSAALSPGMQLSPAVLGGTGATPFGGPATAGPATAAAAAGGVAPWGGSGVAGGGWSQGRQRRQRLDVAQRFESVLSSLQQRVNSLSLSPAPSPLPQPPAATTATATPTAEGSGAAVTTSAGSCVAEYGVQSSFAASPATLLSPADTLGGAEAAAAATPDSKALEGGRHGGGLFARWDTARSPSAAAADTQAESGGSFWQQSEGTQTDPPTAPDAAYFRASAKRAPGASAGRPGWRGWAANNLLRPLFLLGAYLTALLVLPLNRLMFNRWSAVVAAGGNLLAGTAGLALLLLADHTSRLGEWLRTQ